MTLQEKNTIDSYYPYRAHTEFAANFKAIAEKILDFDVVEE
jgi:hypothetical protein